MASESFKPRILIVGGGLGGLTLAQCLRKQNIPFEIFERDTNPVSRISGWAIALHTKVTSVEEDESGVRVHFEDGTTASGDILVGADGVNSIVREHVLQRPNSEILQTFPAAMVVGETTLSGKLFENQLALGHSCYVRSGPEDSGYFFFCGLSRVNPDGNSGRYYWYVVDEDDDVDKEDHWLHSASQAEKLDYAIKVTRTLEPKFTEIIRSTPVSGMRTHSLLVRDAMIHDLPVSRITLLGDAVHPMTPFRGEGGVHAIRDALNLGRALGQLSSNDTREIESLLGPYQREMIERGIPAVRGSRMQGSTNAHSPNTGGEDKIVAWGQVPKPAPEETISLEECRA
ncbi:hypothetical protein Hte_008396 [Hypoxylon texense]